MILKALYDYYHRLKETGGKLAPRGFKELEIPFLIVIDENGKFCRIEDRRFDKKSAQKFFVVSGSRSSGINPYLMYDNLEYVFGISSDENKQENKQEKILDRHDAFVSKCKELSSRYPDCKAFSAVCAFYSGDEKENVKNDPLWDELLKKPGINVSFLLQGETTVAASMEELYKEVDDEDGGNHVQYCLVTGKKGDIVETTPSTMIPGSQATAKIVAFQVNSGYDSYGKSQCYNAPISREAADTYTTALLKLLEKDSKNKFYIGNRTFLFWASSNSEGAQALESSIYSFFEVSDKKEDNPNRRIDEIRQTFEAVYSGRLKTEADDRFYVLGLSPNSARISVVYWDETDMKGFSQMILKHFSDMEIVDGRKDRRPYRGVPAMLRAVTRGGKLSDVQPNLPEATVRSIFQGLQYPHSLYASAIKRIRAEQSEGMRIERVAIIKAYLNRININNNKKLTVMIDKTNDNQGYLCGRLFAVIEYAQKRASNINTIRERYMNSASATPAAVFPTILNLSVHHVEKLDNSRTRTYMEKLKQEIIELLPAIGFPTHLDLQDQGRFFVGYYHQMQEFYASKDATNE